MINKLPNMNLDLQATSVYDFNELTLQELLCKFFSKINECVDVSNQALNFLTWLKEEGLPIEVQKEIEKMYLDGRLTEIINQLANDVKGQVTEIKQDLANHKTEYEQFKTSTNETLTSHTSQLEQKTDDVMLLEQEKLIKEVLATESLKISNRDFIIYQAEIKNPLNLSYVNMPFGIKIKFDKGECISSKNILVKDTNGNIIPFQWEGEKHPNYLLKDISNLSTYSDGSLNGGIIWVMGNLNVNEIKKYTIEVYSREVNNGYTDNIQLVVNSSNPTAPKDELTAGICKFQFDSSTGNYHLRRYYQNGIDLTESLSYNAVIYPFIKNSSNTDVELRGNSDLWNSSKTCIGNGVVFKEYIVTNTLIAKPSINITTIYRIFANGMLLIDCRLLSTEGTTDRTIQGFGLKYKAKTNPIYTETNGDLLACKWSNTEGVLMKLVNTNMHLDMINPQQSYNIQVFADTTQTNVYWVSTSDKYLNPNSLFYIKSFFVPFIGSNVTDRRNLVDLLLNMPQVHATKYNKKQLENRYLKLCKQFAEHMHTFNFQNEFPCLKEYEKFAFNKLNNEIRELINVQELANYVSKLETTYGGATVDGFKNTYLGGRGIEFIGRDTGVIWFIREQFKRLNKMESYNKLTNIIHNLADFYVWVEQYSGSNGSIKLKFDFIDNMNAEATAMKAIKNSLRIEENQNRYIVYHRIKTRLESSVYYNSVFPYSLDHPLSYNAQFHYHAFTLFEYLESVDFQPSFDVASHINQVVTSSGKIFELGYEYAPQRFGFTHSYTYSAYVMYHYGTISSLETACRLIENIISQCFPSGYHYFPLDGWKKINDTIDQPIECQTAYQSIMEKIFLN